MNQITFHWNFLSNSQHIIIWLPKITKLKLKTHITITDKLFHLKKKLIIHNFLTNARNWGNKTRRLQEIILRKVFSTADIGKKLDTKMEDRTKKKQKDDHSDVHACMEDTVSITFLLHFNEHFSLSIWTVLLR
jgi:hypothetical protein